VCLSAHPTFTKPVNSVMPLRGDTRYRLPTGSLKKHHTYKQETIWYLRCSAALAEPFGTSGAAWHSLSQLGTSGAAWHSLHRLVPQVQRGTRCTVWYLRCSVALAEPFGTSGAARHSLRHLVPQVQRGTRWAIWYLRCSVALAEPFGTSDAAWHSLSQLGTSGAAWHSLSRLWRNTPRPQLF
jgi:hypothetical protein